MISFFCKGHKNVLSMHRTTLEFTKDKDLTLKGDCIIGVEANFKPEELKKILKYNKIKIILETEDYSDEFECTVNKDFSDDEEIVIRTTAFISERTLGIHSDKAAKDIDRKIIEQMKNPSTKLKVTIKKIK